jgi:hypothetical protein
VRIHIDRNVDSVVVNSFDCIAMHYFRNGGLMRAKAER